jgi:catalase
MKCSIENCKNEATIKNMCRNHYQQWRYKNDKKYREIKKESSKEHSRRYRMKKIMENVHYDRDKSRQYRKKNKDKHTYSLAKHYWKKLTPEQREKLINELKIRNMFV